MLTVDELKAVIGSSLDDGDVLMKNSENIISSYNELNQTTETQKTMIDELKQKNDELRDELRGLYRKQLMQGTALINEPVQRTSREIADEIKSKLLKK